MTPSDPCPRFSAAQREAAMLIVAEVANRLQKPEQVEAAIATSDRQSDSSHLVPWRDYSVARGYAGLALLFGHLDRCFPDDGWDRRAHPYLERAVAGAERESNLPIGLFAGLSGVGFVVNYLSRGGTRYRRLCTHIADHLLPRAIEFAKDVRETRDGMAVYQFDVISGLTGVGVYLLERWTQLGRDDELRAILDAFVILTRASRDVPWWHTPPHLLTGDGMLQRYPEGNLNCGLAHGIPGPLALLALARLQHVEVDGLDDAIEHIANWLLAHRADDAWGINWPIAVPMPLAIRSVRPVPQPTPSHTAWCYGTPGVARALWLAGEALDSSTFRDHAVAAMAAVCRKPNSARQIPSGTFCHGVSGLLQITIRFARDTRMPCFDDAAVDLLTQVLAKFDPDRLLGFVSLEAGGRVVDQPGLLEGAPGVALALLSVATDLDPAWDRLFLLN